MPTAYFSPMATRIYLQAQAALTSINNSSGVWSNSGAQFVKVEQGALTLSPREPKVPLNLVTGSPSPAGSIQGRKAGDWSLTIPIIPSGTQAVAPDIDLALQSIFGAAGSAKTGTVFGNAWEYNFSNFTVVPLAIFGFIHGSSTAGSRYAVGAVTSRATINFNSDILSMALSGTAYAIGRQETFSIQDTEAKGGLTTWPTEPGSYTTNGQVVHGYGITITASDMSSGSPTNPQVLAGQANQFTFNINTGITLYEQFVDTLYPGAVLYGGRSVTTSLGTLNNDSAACTFLKQAAYTNKFLRFDITLGSIAGQRIYFRADNVQLTPESLSDQGSYVQVSFGDALASSPTGGSNDFLMGFA